MLVLTARFTVAPDSAERFGAALRDLIEPTRAETGCHVFTVTSDVTDPNSFVVIEEWDDKAALDAHMASEHFQGFRAAIGELQLVGREVTMYSAERIS